MRALFGALILTALAGSCGRGGDSWTAIEGQPVSQAPTTVLVELFTSEGCSSCPPADEVLGELVARQLVENVTVVGLGEHVDYWDRLGWRDPFSTAAFTARQSEYAARAFRSASIYTPQLVVDGRFQEIGSDRAAVRRAIVQAATEPKARVDILGVTSSTGQVRAEIHVDVQPDLRRNGVADLFVALVENGLETNVQRGENRGRQLKHSAVTRSLSSLGAIEPSGFTLSRTATVDLSPDWKRAAMQVVAFVQERQTRHIIGAAAMRVEGEDRR